MPGLFLFSAFFVDLVLTLFAVPLLVVSWQHFHVEAVCVEPLDNALVNISYILIVAADKHAFVRLSTVAVQFYMCLRFNEALIIRTYESNLPPV